MTEVEEILALVKRRPGITEPQMAANLFPGNDYQQRVNSTCRRLRAEGLIHRRGDGGAGAPFKYYLGKGR